MALIAGFVCLTSAYWPWSNLIYTASRPTTATPVVNLHLPYTQQQRCIHIASKGQQRPRCIPSHLQILHLDEPPLHVHTLCQSPHRHPRFPRLRHHHNSQTLIKIKTKTSHHDPRSLRWESSLTPHQWQHTSACHATTPPPMFRNSSHCRIRHSRRGVQHNSRYLHSSQILGREKCRRRTE